MSKRSAGREREESLGKGRQKRMGSRFKVEMGNFEQT